MFGADRLEFEVCIDRLFPKAQEDFRKRFAMEKFIDGVRGIYLQQVLQIIRHQMLLYLYYSHCLAGPITKCTIKDHNNTDD